MTENLTPNLTGALNLKRYYRLHASIYDATRWTFLFARNQVIDFLPPNLKPKNILDIGCGTGKNLLHLKKRFPEAQLSGIDTSNDMLEKARNKLGTRAKLYSGYYGMEQTELTPPFDLIVFSYSLSMMGANRQLVLAQAKQDLSEHGYIAVVDFFNSPFALFRKWMQMNHVQMNGSLLEELNKVFVLVKGITIPVYAGIWHYCLYVGQKKKLT